MQRHIIYIKIGTCGLGSGLMNLSPLSSSADGPSPIMLRSGPEQKKKSLLLINYCRGLFKLLKFGSELIPAACIFLSIPTCKV